jgi:hypothetical protein
LPCCLCSEVESKFQEISGNFGYLNIFKKPKQEERKSRDWIFSSTRKSAFQKRNPKTKAQKKNPEHVTHTFPLRRHLLKHLHVLHRKLDDQPGRRKFFKNFWFVVGGVEGEEGVLVIFKFHKSETLAQWMSFFVLGLGVHWDLDLVWGEVGRRVKGKEKGEEREGMGVWEEGGGRERKRKGEDGRKGEEEGGRRRKREEERKAKKNVPVLSCHF